MTIDFCQIVFTDPNSWDSLTYTLLNPPSWLANKGGTLIIDP